MPKEEFEQYMSGNNVLPNTWDSTLIMLESMHLMNEHFSILDDLRSRNENLLKGTEALSNDLIQFKEEVNMKVTGVLARTQLELRPRKPAVDLDSEDPKICELPPPIAPVIVNTEVPPVKIKQERLTAECNVFSETLKLSEGLDFSMTESKSLDEMRLNSLKSVSYDIDLSDTSADNSCADDSQTQPLLGIDKSPVNFQLNLSSESSLLDSTGSPTSNLWLPSPLKPTQSMFSSNNWDIPSIPCNTGDFNSLQPIPENPKNDKV